MNHPSFQTSPPAHGRATRFATAAALSFIGLISPPAHAEAGMTLSLCGVNEETVFACTLERNKKIVSLCATPASNFYYAYGRPASIELRYPSRDIQEIAFTRTHLSFAGNTGGYAYAFRNGTYKYILYSISGERNYERSGLIVQRDGSARALQDMHCQASTVVETENDLTLKATYQWSRDSEIESTGLPSLR